MKNFTGISVGRTYAARLTFLSVCLISLSHFVSAQTYTTFPNLAYANDGNTRHLLDLYVPDGSTSPVPLIIWIHGGGWQAGDKSLGSNSFQLRLARDGYAVASINYRLSGEAIFPAQINDCKAAIRWLRANAAQYNLDPTRIGVWGSSAGGHLAALVGTSNDVTDLEGTVGGNLQYSSRVQAVGDWYGPTDFLQMDVQAGQAGCIGSNHNSANSPESRLLGCSIQTCPQAVQRANPMTYATRDDPPFFIQHGLVDCTVPPGQSQIFQNLLQSIELDTSLTLFDATGHGGAAFTSTTNLAFTDAFWNTKLKQSVNPLVNSIKIYRKSAEVGFFRVGSLGSLYRIAVSGTNFQADTKVLINGIEKAVSFTNSNEVIVHGMVGRIPASGGIRVQLRNSNGRYSNVISSEIRAE